MMMPLLLGLVLQAGPPPLDSLRLALLAAEDARAPTPAMVTTLTGAVRHRDSTIQRQAVRALGRLERPELLGGLGPALDAASASVRIEAANAVAQAVYRVDGAAALALLAGQLDREPLPVVQGALLAAMGRLGLAPGSAGAREAERRITRALGSDGAQVGGALRGAWDLLRRQGRAANPGPELVALLRQRVGSAPDPLGGRLALMTLIALGRTDSALVREALQSRDPQLRRLAVNAARAQRDFSGRAALLRPAFDDPSGMVRIEAVGAWAAHLRASDGCAPLIAATRDSLLAVQLLAIDALSAGCGPVRAPADLLESILREPVGADRWHRPVRALLALAAADSARAALYLAGFTAAPIWWVRMHAATAAGRVRDGVALRRLAADSVDNVREAALAALVSLEGHGADSVALRQLARRDYQLVRSAAEALKGSPLGAAVATGAGGALRRVTAEQKETSRDTRMALLDRIDEFGTAADGAALRALRQDFDPVVARRAAAIASRLTGVAVSADPRPLPPMPLPTADEWSGARRAVLVLRGVGRVEILLAPATAPLNVTRFVRMVRAGWFTGLTLHRIAPNFVVQGGSPGANEYAGGAEFARDEVGGSHLRGTVGISTRGRDTGDGQLFFNLIDNLRLDHDYTVIGAVVAGLDLLERIFEGAVIERVDLLP